MAVGMSTYWWVEYLVCRVVLMMGWVQGTKSIVLSYLGDGDDIESMAILILICGCVFFVQNSVY
eukprot:GDKH01023436.1.p2 GENE.GDKH01023436.1~~GDKH01023436.1.p2  ORF type:complete len:64 (-),score=0.22 GDKH01023436.1:89-280(-)